MGYVADIVIVVLLLLTAVFGFKKGFAKKDWWLIDLVLIVALGFLFVSKINAKIIETSLDDKILGWLQSVMGKADESGEMVPKLVNLIVSIMSWAGIAIVVWIGMGILHAILKRLAETPILSIIDKILGGAYAIVVTAAVLVVIGALVGTCENFEPIQKICDICREGKIAPFVLGENPLQDFFNQYIPVGTWIGKVVNR